MNKSKAYTSILFIGLTLGALMAGFSVIQKSNIVNYQWDAKIEDTSIPMEKYLVQLEGLAKDKRPSKLL